MSDNAIRLDPAVAAAKRVMAQLHTMPVLPPGFNDDVVTMVIVILRLAGHQITDQTGEGVPNTVVSK
jgi:hypothetical protein